MSEASLASSPALGDQDPADPPPLFALVVQGTVGVTGAVLGGGALTLLLRGPPSIQAALGFPTAWGFTELLGAAVGCGVALGVLLGLALHRALHGRYDQALLAVMATPIFAGGSSRLVGFFARAGGAEGAFLSLAALVGDPILWLSAGLLGFAVVSCYGPPLLLRHRGASASAQSLGAFLGAAMFSLSLFQMPERHQLTLGVFTLLQAPFLPTFFNLGERAARAALAALGQPNAWPVRSGPRPRRARLWWASQRELLGGTSLPRYVASAARQVLPELRPVWVYAPPLLLLLALCQAAIAVMGVGWWEESFGISFGLAWFSYSKVTVTVQGTLACVVVFVQVLVSGHRGALPLRRPWLLIAAGLLWLAAASAAEGGDRVVLWLVVLTVLAPVAGRLVSPIYLGLGLLSCLALSHAFTPWAWYLGVWLPPFFSYSPHSAVITCVEGAGAILLGAGALVAAGKPKQAWATPFFALLVGLLLASLSLEVVLVDTWLFFPAWFYALPCSVLAGAGLGAGLSRWAGGRRLAVIAVAALVAVVVLPKLVQRRPYPASFEVKALVARAEDGDVAAMQQLYRRYRLGVGVQADLAQAFQWLESAAEGGDPDAMYCLGVGLELGRNCVPDPEAGRAWIQRAALAGHARAQERAGS